jgi:hypothetical protein
MIDYALEEARLGGVQVASGQPAGRDWRAPPAATIEMPNVLSHFATQQRLIFNRA